MNSEIAEVPIAAGVKRSRAFLLNLPLGSPSKCKSGRRSANTGQCLPKRKSCKTNQIRSQKTGRCHKPRKASRRLSKGKYSSTLFAGGEATLTAGALEEAFHAGLIAGRGF